MTQEQAFDEYDQTYQDTVQQAIQFVGQEYDFFMEVKVNQFLECAREGLGGINQAKILDMGCGIGLADRSIVHQVKELHGVDVSEKSLQKAAEINPRAHYQRYDGLRLPFENSTFDAAFAMNVFHHIKPADWDSAARELYRVVRPGGLVFIFEHNPFNPLTRIVVARCPFDADAVLLSRKASALRLQNAGFFLSKKSYILFFPWRGKVFRFAEKMLNWMPLGAQHFVMGRK